MVEEYRWGEEPGISVIQRTGLKGEVVESRSTFRKTAVEAFQITECRGMARIDFFLNSDNSFILNEINTLPGFTNISMYPKLWEASGLLYPELLDRLIGLALE